MRTVVFFCAVLVAMAVPSRADTITRLVCKEFNPSLLSEELAGLIFAPTRQPFLRGFVRVSDRQRTPSAGPIIVGTSSSGGVTTTDTAEACEARFDFAGTATVVDLATLDAVLAAHDWTVLTAEQQRQNQDVADLAQILSWRSTYLGHLAAWETYNTNERNSATKDMLDYLDRVTRIMLRRLEGSEI